MMSTDTFQQAAPARWGSGTLADVYTREFAVHERRITDYTKALLRRAVAQEALGDPSAALEDAKRAAEMDPSSKEAAEMVPRLERAAAAHLEQQKEEMMGKLKDLGNTVLGKFGMSLDNFKATQDPNTGSYSISFQQ